MSLSQTTFEKFKINHFVFSIPSLVGMKILFKNYFLSSQRGNSKIEKEKRSILNFSKVIRDINNKISQTVTDLGATRIDFMQKFPKLQMDMAGSFFDPHNPNLVSFHISPNCKNDEIFCKVISTGFRFSENQCGSSIHIQLEDSLLQGSEPTYENKQRESS